MRCASERTESEVRLRSLPRVNGTTQYEQNLSQPSIMVMYPRCGLVRAVNSVSKHSSVWRSSSPVTRRLPVSSCTSISGRLRYAPEHAEFLALLLILLVVGETVKHLLLGLIANRAGVVKHKAGFFDARDLAVTFRNQRTHDFFGIVGVHLAAEGLQI